MKKIGITAFLAALVAITTFCFVGCTGKTFDDIAYGVGTSSALQSVSTFNNARQAMLTRTAEYETTDINETITGTTKTVTTHKFGKISGALFTQKTIVTFVGDTQSYVTETRYKNKFYTDTNGTVVSTDDLGMINIETFVYSFIPSMNESTPSAVTLTEEKRFEDINYQRLTISPKFINNLRPQQNGSIISDFKYEFGIHSASSYLVMYRTTEVISAYVQSPNSDEWPKFNHTTTTILKNSGENVQVTIPIV